MNTSSATAVGGPVLCSDLVRHELQAKNAAIAGYVEILWKIRSGFVVVTGAIVALGTKDGNAAASLMQLGRDRYAAVALVAILACLLDLLYFWREHLVIRAYHCLIDYALDRAPDRSESSAVAESADRAVHHDVDKAFASVHSGRTTVRSLLRVSGEGHGGSLQWLQRIIPYLLYVVPFALCVLGWLRASR